MDTDVSSCFNHLLNTLLVTVFKWVSGVCVSMWSVYGRCGSVGCVMGEGNFNHRMLYHLKTITWHWPTRSMVCPSTINKVRGYHQNYMTTIDFSALIHYINSWLAYSLLQMITLHSTQTFQPHYKHTNTSFPSQMVKMEASFSGWRHIRGNYMGGGTGLADSATAGPTFAVWCLKIQQGDLRGPKFPKTHTLCR